MNYTTNRTVEELQALPLKELKDLYHTWSRWSRAVTEELCNHDEKIRQVDCIIRKKTGALQSWKDRNRRIVAERRCAGKLHRQGKTIKEIAEIMQISDGQAFSRVKQWKKANQTNTTP